MILAVILARALCSNKIIRFLPETHEVTLMSKRKLSQALSTTALTPIVGIL